MSVGERTLAVAYGSHKVKREFKDLEPSVCLYIGNLPYEAAAQDIEDVLGAIGKISIVRLGLF
jgi:RNA recognition motif-containing protein